MFSRRKRVIRRVLIVEDEPLVAFENEHLLTDAGYEVIATVDNAADALMILGRHALDLVLADISLSGGGSGLDVARAAAARGVRVLFAAGQCPVGAEAFSVGCLGKPFSQRELLDSLEAVDALASGARPRRTPRGLKLFAGSGGDEDQRGTGPETE